MKDLIMSTGRLTVFAGPMFAGKTEALIARATRVRSGDRKVYKPTTDTRQGDGYILSHGGISIDAEWVDPSLECVVTARNVFVDEAQFLTPPAVEKVLSLLRHGSTVVLSGLDLDANAQPFGQMPTFLSIADEVVKVQGTCSVCSRPSIRTKSKVRVDGILVGGSETYEPRCLSCYSLV